MNEIKAQDGGSNASTSLTSTPQAFVPEKQASQETLQAVTATAKAESVGASKGKIMPDENLQQSAQAKSEEVEEAVSKLNEYVQKTQRNLDFSLDEDSGKTVIRVYDSQSEQLVRQIPDEVALELAKKLNTEEPALLFSAQV